MAWAGAVVAAAGLAYTYHSTEEQKRTTQQATDRMTQKADKDAAALAGKTALDDAKAAQAAQTQAANQARADASAAASAQIKTDRQRKSLLGNRNPSILTGPLGVPGETASSGKTLLGY